MDLSIAAYATYLALGIGIGVVCLLLCYLRHRRKQRRLAAIHQVPPVQDDTDEPHDVSYIDRFYCLRLSDGTYRSGYIDPPAE